MSYSFVHDITLSPWILTRSSCLSHGSFHHHTQNISVVLMSSDGWFRNLNKNYNVTDSVSRGV